MKTGQIGLLLVMTACGSALSAQTANCMRMGSDMVTCHSTNGTVTNCMAMGSDMAHCTTTGGASPSTAAQGDGGAVLGQSVVGFVRSIQERSFKKKIGTMLANGDCIGAAKFALEKGRLELGVAIQQACQRNTDQPVAGVLSVEDSVAKLAEVAKRGEIEPGLRLKDATANGSQLILSLVAEGAATDIDGQRARWVAESCSNDDFRKLYEGGATLRANYHTKDGAPLGTFLLTAGDCGVK